MKNLHKAFIGIWTTTYSCLLLAGGAQTLSGSSMQKQPFIHQLFRAINDTNLQKVVDLLNDNVNTINPTTINMTPFGFGKSPIEAAFEKAVIIEDDKIIALGNDNALSILYLLVNCRADLASLHDIIYTFLDASTLEPKFDKFASRELALKFKKMIAELQNTAANPLCGTNSSKQSWFDWLLSKLN